MLDFTPSTDIARFAAGFDLPAGDGARARTLPLLPVEEARAADGVAAWTTTAGGWSTALPWLHRMVEVMPEAVLVLGPRGRIEVANRQAARLFGHGAGGLAGRAIDDLLPARERGLLYAHQAAARNADRPVDGVEGRARRADGSEFPMTLSLAPLPTPEGLWTTLTVRDITIARQAEAASAAVHEQLRAANRELEQFVAVASHDLKAPLRSLQGFTRLLVRDLPPAVAADPDIADYLAFLAKSGSHMQALLDGLLLYSRTGRETQPALPVACNDLVGDVEGQLHALLDERDVQLDVGALPTVRGFPLALNQLFQNLLGNAVKFQPGPAPRVRVWADAAPDAAGFHTLHVQDWGIGIAPEHRETVFGIFQRLHDDTEFEGTGVGLAVCARIVARHGGRLWLDSEPGAGSTFHFTLPGVDADVGGPPPGPGDARA